MHTDSIAITISPREIIVNPYQPRKHFDPAALDELADSIRQYGILQPLTVRKREGGYEIIAGERRLQAALRAGLTEVPVVVRECSDEEMLELALVENLQREDLNAMEAAHSYQRLLEEFGLSQTEVAERVGKSRSAVTNTLRLLALPEPMQQAIAAGSISEGHGRALLACENQQRQQAIFEETVHKGYSVRMVESLAKQLPKQRPGKQVPSKESLDANLQQLQTDMQFLLGTRVRFKAGSSEKGGTLEIEYYSAEDLDRIYETLKGQ